MSKTKRDKIKGKYKAADKKYDNLVSRKLKKLLKKGYSWTTAYDLSRKAYERPWDKLSHEEQVKVFSGFRKNPSWWNKIFNRVPKRASDKNKLKKIDLNTDCDGIVFSDDNKPCLYYW